MSLTFKQLKVAIDIAVKANQVPNIVGLQGIGKSDLVREYCRERGYYFSEITCSLIQEGDLSMPYLSPNKDGVNYAVNTIIQDLSDKSSNYEYVILFLDEFNRASEQAQSELMNLVLQRRVVNYNLPDNARIVLAMNPNSDMNGYDNTNYSVSFSDSAIMGRVVNLDMRPVLEDWIDYGRRMDGDRQMVHNSVLNFLVSNKRFFLSPERDGCVNNTPRGWKRVSDIIYSYEEMGMDDLVILSNLVRGTLEEHTSQLFMEHYKSNRTPVDFLKMASNLLNNFDPSVVENLSDVDKVDLFAFMSNRLINGDITANMVENYKLFIKSVSRELCYALITKLQQTESYKDIYETLLEDDSMCKYIMGIMNKVTTKVGGHKFGKLS